MGEVDFFKFALQGGAGVCALLAFAIEDFEVGEAEVGGFAVATSDFVDDADGLFIFPSAHEKLGRFVECEEEKSATEHDHC